MVFHSSPSTTARRSAPRPHLTDVPVRARHKKGDSHGNEAPPEDPTPASADVRRLADLSAEAASLKADSEVPASLGGSRAGTATSGPSAPITESATDIIALPTSTDAMRTPETGPIGMIRAAA